MDELTEFERHVLRGLDCDPHAIKTVSELGAICKLIGLGYVKDRVGGLGGRPVVGTGGTGGSTNVPAEMMHGMGGPAPGVAYVDPRHVDQQARFTVTADGRTALESTDGA